MTDEVTFELGDVVRLKSGGPYMTVHEVRGDGKISVGHFQEFRDGTFGGYQSCEFWKESLCKLGDPAATA